MKLWLFSSACLHLIGGVVVMGTIASTSSTDIPQWVMVEPIGVPSQGPSRPAIALPTEVGSGEASPTGVASPLVGEGNALPHYPEEAIRNAWEGKTELVLTIGSDGTVSDADLWISSGHDSLDDAALESALNWRFLNYSGKRIRVPIQFALND